MDCREVTDLLLLGLSKAFDSWDHSVLLRKLSNVGISKTALVWFKSYLTGRSQSVRIASVLSDECEITRGVPQRSTIGPVLLNKRFAWCTKGVQFGVVCGWLKNIFSIFYQGCRVGSYETRRRHAKNYRLLLSKQFVGESRKKLRCSY
jgi:hypothetical protein